MFVPVDERVPLDTLEAVTFDEGRAKGAFVIFTFALLIGPICGGGAFLIHWFAGIVFAFVPILVGMVWLLIGVIRKPRLILERGGERRVWLLPYDLDFEAANILVDRVQARLQAL